MTLRNLFAGMLLVSLCTLIASPRLASAALIAADTFDDKAVGDLNGQGGGYGNWDGNWSGDVRFDVTDSGAVQGGDGNIGRWFTGTSVGDTLYVAATLQAPGADLGYRFMIRLFDPASTANMNVFGLRDVEFAINDAKSNLFGNAGQPTADSFKATPWRIVVRVEPNYDGGANDRYTLWADDYSDGTFDLTEASAHTMQQTGNFFGDVALRAVAISGIANNDSRTVDDLNISTTFDEAAHNVVPEPAALSLLGLGAAAFLRRRRR